MGIKKEEMNTIKMIEQMNGTKLYLYQKLIIVALITQGKIINKWYKRHIKMVNRYISMKGRI